MSAFHSHHKTRRKTTICPNCDAILDRKENFCHVCGQENHNLDVPLKHFVLEIIESVFHFETKFWNTFKALFTRPGQITLHFFEGKRARYMLPLRLYFFVSAAFFYLSSVGQDFQKKETGTSKKPIVEIKTDKENPRGNGYKLGKKIGKFFGYKSDTTLSAQKRWQLKIRNDTNYVKLGMYDPLFVHKDSLGYFYALSPSSFDSVLKVYGISTFFANKKTIHNDLTKKFSAYDAEKNHVPDEYQLQAQDRLMHMGSILVFIMMPFAAYLLYLFYRRTKWKYYYQHLIFTLHVHTAAFLFFTIPTLVELFYNFFEIHSNKLLMDMFGGFLYFLALIYFFWSLKVVFKQGWGKTILKFVLLTTCYTFLGFIFFLGFVLTGFFYM